MTFKRLFLALLILVLLVAAYFAVVLNWSYSSGERAGWVQKLSDKGWICKTWEGELALVSLPGTATVEKFYFTVHDDETAAQLAKAMGKRVSLHYEQKVGLPTTCFGDTRYFVTKVTVSDDVSIAPGVTVPQAPVVAPVVAPAAPAASPAR
ncbi:MAG: hypothetical protein AD742_15410 [Methylibium sp. NZG]|nr:MAG: hypothetical protein AD742_15410 [Methylibium sp. NZG]